MVTAKGRVKTLVCPKCRKKMKHDMMVLKAKGTIFVCRGCDHVVKLSGKEGELK